MSVLLSVDTSGSALGLALSFGEDRLIKSLEPAERNQSQTIMKKIEDLCASAGTPLSALTGLVVATGPGSFTGLRIGIAVCKGIAVARDVPVVGISNFAVAAAQLANEERAVWLITSVRRDEFILARAEEGRFVPESVCVVTLDGLESAVGEEAFAFLDADAQLVVATSEKRNLTARISSDPALLLRLGGERLNNSGGDDLVALEPMYVRKSQMELNFERRRA